MSGLETDAGLRRAAVCGEGWYGFFFAWGFYDSGAKERAARV